MTVGSGDGDVSVGSGDVTEGSGDGVMIVV